MSRPPHLLAWKLWEKIRRGRDRRRRWEPAAPPLRVSRPALEASLGSRFFRSSEDLDATCSILEARDPAWRKTLETRALRILEGRFSILGAGDCEVGSEIQWSKDYRSGLSWNVGDHSFDYDLLDFGRPTDVRVVWEMSRLHELVLLGQAYRATRRSEYFRRFRELATSWLDQNPVGRSVNWSCAMEVAIRAVNLVWAVALFLPCEELDDEFLEALLSSLATHGRFVRRNIEWNDLRNNHYLSDLAGLLVIGVFLPELSESRAWIRFAAHRLEREARIQVHPDGVDYEGSIPYQQLVTEIYLACAAILERVGREFSADTLTRIHAMLDFVAAYTKPDGRAPVIGDNDDGRLLVLGPQPRGDHRHLLSTGGVLFGRRELVAAARGVAEETLWMLGRRAEEFESPAMTPSGKSAAFPHGGFYVMRAGETHVVIDAGPVGIRGRGAHGHHDPLSFELVLRGDELVIDSGASSYTADRIERARVISVFAHNAPSIDHRDVATIDEWGFVQAGTVPVEVRSWTSGEAADELVAEHRGYRKRRRGPLVRRTFRLDKRDHRFTVRDEIMGSGEHLVTIPFHLHPSCTARVVGSEVVIRARRGDCRLSARNAEGRWSLVPAVAYLEYARPATILRAEFTVTSRLPIEVEFVMRTD